MKKIDVNEIIAWLGGGAAAGAAFARQYFGSERSLLIGEILGFLIMGYLWYHSHRKRQSNRKQGE
jgi:hypothetical protein